MAAQSSISAPGRRFYSGGVIVAVGFCTMLLVQGSCASSGVLFAALAKEYGWSRATISLPSQDNTQQSMPYTSISLKNE